MDEKLNRWFDNEVFCCDNISLLKRLPDNSIDLIYCDILFGGRKNIKDYNDIENKRSSIDNFYLPRTHEMYRILKSSGSIYIHCDYKINHWVRCILDNVFGYNNLMNEIVWRYRTGNLSKKMFRRSHDIIYLYKKTKENYFQPQEVKEYYDCIYGKGFAPSFKGRKHGADEYGEFRISQVDDVWDISAVFTLGKEWVNYQTQKPKALLERIIKASSNKGDIVADFFCGSGTALVVAKELGRKYLGCDIGKKAINITRERLGKI